MAIKLGEMFFALGLGTASFTKNLGDTKKLAFGSFKEIERSAKIMGTAIVAAAGLAGAGLLALVKRQINVADEMKKLSDRTGVAVETLTAYAHGAELAGVGTEDLATAFNQIAKRALDAQQGMKEYVRAFQAAGVEFQNADGSLRTLDQLLGDVAERFSKMENGTAKAALAQELFGRSGAKLIPFLNLGRAGLEQVREEAERLGLVIDTKTAAAAELFNDNLTRLKGVLIGFANQIMTLNIPTLAGMSDALMAVAGQAEAAGDEITDSFLNRLAIGFFGLRGIMEDNLQFYGSTFKALAAVAAGPAGAGAFATAMEEIRGALNFENANARVEQATKLLLGWREAAERLAGRGGGGGGGLPGLTTETEKFTAQMVKLGNLPMFLRRFAGLAELTPQGAIGEGGIFSFLRGLDAAEAAVFKRFEQQTLQDIFTRGRVGKFADLDRDVKKVAESANLLKANFVQAFQAIGQDLENAIVHFKGFGNVMVSVLQEIQRALIRTFIISPFVGFLTKGLSAVLGGALGGGAIKVGGLSFPPVPTPPIPKQFGGAAFAGQPLLVGEGGPEIFVPHTGGQIVPNGKVGGTTIINNIDARGGAPGIEHRIREVLRAVHDAAVGNAVVRMRESSARSL